MTLDEMLEEANKTKVRKRPSHREDDLERACVRWFDLQHPDKKLLLHHSPNEGDRSEREGARNRDLGTRRGFPDLILLKSSNYYDYLAIELKSDTGRLTEHQKAYQKVVNESGGCYIVIRSVQSFVAAITDYLSQKLMDEWQTKN